MNIIPISQRKMIKNLTHIFLLTGFFIAFASCNKDDIPDDREVFIEEQQYNPKTLNIQRGAMVKWINKGQVPHSVTRADDPDSFNSGKISPGERFTYTFKTSGHFSYFCTLHDNQHVGYVIVE